MQEGNEILHGPGSSAERLDGRRRRRAPRTEDEKNFWKQRLQKLQQQSPLATSKALEGVVVYFEGYTDELSAYKLKQMLCAQGGKVSHYFSKANTTHVVCTNLSMSKYRSLQGAHGKRSIKLVHPDWLRSSCEAGKKLPENQFLISADQTLGRIDSFFTRTTTDKDDKPHKRKQPEETTESEAQQKHLPTLTKSCSSITTQQDTSHSCEMKPEKDSYVRTTMVAVPTSDAKRQRKEKKPLGVEQPSSPSPSPSPSQQPEGKQDVNKQNNYNNRNATREGTREKPPSPLNSRPAAAAAEDTTDVVETKSKKTKKTKKTKSSEKPSPSLLLLQKFSPHRKVIARFPAAAAASSASATSWPPAATK